ncbi:MAG: hypothetical protein LWY06_01365 [Firmicutes bacterium]|nr:hypothetical protein [Bacillota bacterium]
MIKEWDLFFSGDTLGVPGRKISGQNILQLNIPLKAPDGSVYLGHSIYLLDESFWFCLKYEKPGKNNVFRTPVMEITDNKKNKYNSMQIITRPDKAIFYNFYPSLDKKASEISFIYNGSSIDEVNSIEKSRTQILSDIVTANAGRPSEEINVLIEKELLRQTPDMVRSGAAFSIGGRKTDLSKYLSEDPFAQMAMSIIKPAKKCLGKLKIQIQQ